MALPYSSFHPQTLFTKPSLPRSCLERPSSRASFFSTTTWTDKPLIIKIHLNSSKEIQIYLCCNTSVIASRNPKGHFAPHPVVSCDSILNTVCQGMTQVQLPRHIWWGDHHHEHALRGSILHTLSAILRFEEALLLPPGVPRKDGWKVCLFILLSQ